jgi:hypothetical protein
LTNVDGQKPSSVVYLAYQPADHGMGVRVDHYLNEILGFYGSVTYGNWGVYRTVGYTNHLKATFGTILPITYHMEKQFGATVGFNYHYAEPDYKPNYNIYSFELGITMNYSRFSLGLRTDILNWEPCVDVGFLLRPPTMRERRASICRGY